jgi:hypothetical protein
VSRRITNGIDGEGKEEIGSEREGGEDYVKLVSWISFVEGRAKSGEVRRRSERDDMKTRRYR